MQQQLNIENLRCSLIRQEETIIFALIERAQFRQNLIIYKENGISIPNYNGSFSDYLLNETEVIHAKVRRYTSPDEYSFFQNLPKPILPPIKYPHAIKPSKKNVNEKIRKSYIERIIPIICSQGDDENYGSSATCDVVCLQSISKRVHYGKFVAEVKFREDSETYTRLIRASDADAIIKKLTFKDIENRLLNRVEQKATTYGQDIDFSKQKARFKIDPKTIRQIYEDWLIPLTKEVELDYLLNRLDET